MGRRRGGTAVLVVFVVAVGGCSRAVDGDAVWPGTLLNKVLLTASEVPRGARYDRPPVDHASVNDDSSPGVPIESLKSIPSGCADGMTARVAAVGRPGPENTARFIARFNGANIIVSVVRWTLNLDSFKDIAAKCANYQIFFSEDLPGTPMSISPVSDAPQGILAYKQAMSLARGSANSYVAFANVDGLAVIATSFELRDPSVSATATMPKTFLDLVQTQVDKIRRG